MANRRFIDFPIATTVGDNDIVLIWQDGANKQTTKATILSGLPKNLEDLNDVVISGLTNGQILRYDSVTGKWENTDQGNLDLNDLNDVSIVSPSNGQVLVYNSSTSKWENSSGGFVPYVGAVTTVDLGAQGLRAGYVRFDTSVVAVPDEQGLMYWDDARSTVALIMNGTLQHIGQDSFFYVKNSSGSTIPKGTCVGFAGTDGASGHLLVTPFLANGSVPSTYFMGVTSEEIANGAFGQVMHFGELEGINTSGFTAGALLYASNTVAGAFQTTPPVAPNNIILVAAAVNSKNNGAIVVRPTYGSNINSDEGVKITSVANLDLLQYQSGTGLWENKTLSQVIGSAYVPSTRTLTINGTAFDLSANRSWIVGDVRTDGSYSNPSWITALAWSKITGTPTTLSGYGITDAYTETEVDSLLAGYVTLNTFQNISGSKIFGTNRLIMDGEGTAQPTSLSNTQQSNSALASHNSIGFNGSNNIYFNKGTTANGGIFAFSNSATRTYTLKDASGTLAFTSDIPANPVGGTGTTNYLPKFTGSTTIGNSSIADNGSGRVSVGTGNFYDSFVISNAATTGWEFSNSGSVITYNRSTAAYIPMTFEASNYILNRGNLGLGVTPSAWNSSFRAVQVGVGASFWASNISTLPYAYMSSNQLYDASNTSKYIINGFASWYIQEEGTHKWLTAPSGTAGNAISFTQAMTLNASGNLGIGTANPAVKLDVIGEIRSTSTSGYGALVSVSALNLTILADTHTNGNLTFWTAGSEKSRVTSTGNLLVGTTSDNGARLQVSGRGTFTNSNDQLLLKTASTNGSRIGHDALGLYFANDDTSLDVLRIYGGTSGALRLTIASTGAATFSSSVTTGAPAGGTAQPWKLGTVATVSPTSPNRTIEVEVNGTTYYLHAKTTNN